MTEQDFREALLVLIEAMLDGLDPMAREIAGNRYRELLTQVELDRLSMNASHAE